MTSRKNPSFRVDKGSEVVVVSGNEGKKRMGKVNRRDANTEARVEAERALLLVERQRELDTILDRHDDLVREAFHLEQFRTLVSYNIKEAKADTSAVFQTYKAKYDLLGNSSTSDGMSRRTTRRAHQERVELLKGPVAGPSTSSASAPPQKAKQTLSRQVSENGAVCNVFPGTKGKSKDKTGEDPGTSRVSRRSDSTKLAADDAVYQSLSAPTGKGKGRFIGKGRVSFVGFSDNASSEGLVGSSSLSRRKASVVVPTSPANENPTTMEVQPPRKRRKTEPASIDDNVDKNPFPNTQSSPFVTPRPPSKDPITHRRRTESLAAISQSPSNHLLRAAQKQKAVGPPEPMPTVKRIKLIVRQPLPIYTSPQQRPNRPRFDKSLPDLLCSYVMLDNRDLTPSELDGQVREKASFYEKVYKLRQQGRLLLRADLATIIDRDVATAEYERGRDAWDYIVEEVQNRHDERDTGQQIAGSIAKKVRGYWDALAVKEGATRLAEEKMLRKLAKATSKLVVNEWKKAVFHIREQERLKWEAEETRKGRAHLDAILDQSGQILETQQLDLSRAGRSTSRSSSVSATLRDWEDEDEEETEAEAEEGGENESDEEQDEEGGTRADAKELLKEEHEQGEEEEDPTQEVSEEEASSEEEDESITARALLGGSVPPAWNGALQSPRSYGSDLDTKDEFDTFDGPAHEYAPSTQMDDMFSPSSDLVATPPSDAMAMSPTRTSFADSLSQPSFSGTHHSLDYDFPPSLPHPLDEVIFHHDHNDIHPISSPRKQNAMAPVSDVSFIVSTEDLMADSPTPVDSIDSTPAFNQAIFEHHIVTQSDGNQEIVLSASSIQASKSIERRPDDQVDGVSSVVEGNESRREGDAAALAEMEEEEEATVQQEDPEADEGIDGLSPIPGYLRPYAVAPVEWDPESKVMPPALLRGTLRGYQQAGLEWLASLHVANLNGILADEMGLGKTIQTIALLAHLACDRGIWGPHLIIVPTSVLLNWEMEFKKFLPGFKVLAYHGPTKRRKELRQGWNDKFHFNVCVTSYTLASRDAHIFKRKPWYYMILDEAHMIKNFKSQRWNILLMFRSFRRLLLTGTPLQNNLTELWALLQFLMSGTNFANLKEFGEWFSNPLEKAIEMGNVLDDEVQERVSKLHTVLRPYLLRRLKRDVEKELAYTNMTISDLSSGVYQKIANVLMQLRKVCNHPDLFEVRPIVTSFTMQRSAVADFEIKELLIRRRLLQDDSEVSLNLGVLGLHFINQQNTPWISAIETRRLDGTDMLPFSSELLGEPPPYDVRTIKGFKVHREFQERAATIARWTHIGYLNRLRCNQSPIYSSEMLAMMKQCSGPLLPASYLNRAVNYLDTSEYVHATIKSYETRAKDMAPILNNFACVTPSVVARDLPRLALAGREESALEMELNSQFDAILHRASVKLQIAFPDPSLLQYDCGKLQELTRLLRERKAGGHRVLIFTQMTRILDILEIFLNFHGYLYLRLDGATKIEDRQYITERFNSDPRVFCFIASSRSGGVGINLTGADTVIFYDSDFNPQMDRQCEDRAHRIGQIRDVHIYRFISEHTVEEAMLRKANQKRSLDDLVIQKGEFDWRSLFGSAEDIGSEGLTKALEEFEDSEDVYAAKVAAQEEGELEGADEADFGEDAGAEVARSASVDQMVATPVDVREADLEEQEKEDVEDGVTMEDEDEEGGTTVDYMLSFVRYDYDFFRDWKL
ncbi:hypothetical protein EW146_g2357 [Bondarzewia mesenterica]|uniref:Helicase SWR1 n=1 Tax=Bondarzewia mesenterica TaxID=1095465 RepID=A0A4S4M0X1_9AGAM|nr:hypothetical protein EW146_g2357 [Bondarzewia mesenterica]